jgi:hypothetical protein
MSRTRKNRRAAAPTGVYGFEVHVFWPLFHEEILARSGPDYRRTQRRSANLRWAGSLWGLLPTAPTEPGVRQ